MLWFKLLKRAWSGWTNNRASALSASLAFYSLLSLVPLISLAVSLVAWFIGSKSAHQILTFRAREMFGNSVALTLSKTLQATGPPRTSLLTSLFGVGVLLVGGAGVAGELRSSLNLIWGVPTISVSWFEFLRNRSRELLLVVVLLFAVLGVSILGLLISAAGRVVTEVIPAPAFVILAGNFLFSLVVLFLLFLLIHRYVPEASILWRHALAGALCTTALFALGKELLATYIRGFMVGAVFGAGQSVIALLVWAWFSASVLYFGAEYARAWAQYDCSRHSPSPAQESRLT